MWKRVSFNFILMDLNADCRVYLESFFYIDIGNRRTRITDKYPLIVYEYK